MKIILNQKMREKERLQAMQVTLVVCLMNATLTTGTSIVGSGFRDMTTGWAIIKSTIRLLEDSANRHHGSPQIGIVMKNITFWDMTLCSCSTSSLTFQRNASPASLASNSKPSNQSARGRQNVSTENWDSTSLQNAGELLPDCRTSHSRKWKS